MEEVKNKGEIKIISVESYLRKIQKSKENTFSDVYMNKTDNEIEKLRGIIDLERLKQVIIEEERKKIIDNLDKDIIREETVKSISDEVRRKEEESIRKTVRLELELEVYEDIIKENS